MKAFSEVEGTGKGVGTGISGDNQTGGSDIAGGVNA